MQFLFSRGPRFLHRRSIAKAPCTTTRAATTTGIRHLHRAAAEFTRHGVDGKLLTTTEGIWIGDPEDAFVMIPREVGDVFSRLLGGRSGGLTLDSATPSSTSNASNARLPLVFYHDTKCFVLESLPEHPCLKVPVDLPRRQLQDNHVTLSPATLYLYGLMYTIALDGTGGGRSFLLPLPRDYDWNRANSTARFAKLASTVGPDIGHALKLLKDM